MYCLFYSLQSLNTHWFLLSGYWVRINRTYISSFYFLVHLSRRLKCTIVIMRCPSSVRRPSVVVNFSHFRLLLWNHWTEFDKTLQEGSSQHPLPSLCFSGRSEKQDGRPGLWLAETFSTSPLKPLNGIQRNLTGSKISTSSTKFVFFGPIGKTRWPPWPLIGWDIFDFSSETAERNSTKLDRKQDLNVLYQVCVFRADRKNKMAALVSDWLWHFRFLLWNCWTEFNEIWQEARSQRPLPSLCFSGRSEKQDGHPGLWLAETFSTSPLKPLNGIQPNLTGSKISTSSTKFVFFGPIRKTRWPPWSLIGRDIFDFSSETAEWNATKLDRKQDLNVLYQVCVFRADRKNKMATLANPPKRWHILLRCTICGPLGLLLVHLSRRLKCTIVITRCPSVRPSVRRPSVVNFSHFQLLLWNHWTEFNETWQEARSQHPLPSLFFSGWSINKCPPWPIPQKGGTFLLRCMICGPLGLLLLLHFSEHFVSFSSC